MRNQEIWSPSKYILKNGKLKASYNHKEVSISSRIVANAIAKFYNQHIPTHVRGRLIDLGCGKVPLFAAYKPYITASTCVDWANSVHQNPYTDFEQDLNVKLQFPDGSFDTIILSDVLEHIRQPELLIAEMYRILSKDGNLILNVPFYYWLHEEPFDYFRYTKHALHSMASDHGFSVQYLEPYGGAPEILTDILSKLAIKLPVLGKPLAYLLQGTTALFLKTHLGKKISARTARSFPLGYAMIATK